jgi:hypothetical protein
VTLIMSAFLMYVLIAIIAEFAKHPPW